LVTALSMEVAIGAAGRYLGGTTASGGELANMVQEDGALQFVELRCIQCDLGEEWIGHEDRSLIAVACVGVAQQGGDVDLESAGETVERGQGWHGLVANGVGYLQAAFLGCGWGNQRQWCGSRFGLFDLEAFVAAAAQRVGCPELHQTAVVAT
jgi:hypothetical protein